jgi:hypothetical protein
MLWPKEEDLSGILTRDEMTSLIKSAFPGIKKPGKINQKISLLFKKSGNGWTKKEEMSQPDHPSSGSEKPYFVR